MEVEETKKPAKPGPPARKPAGLSSATREYQNIKEICVQLQNLATQFQRESKLRGALDLEDLRRLTENSKQEDEMALISMEAVVSIVNFSARKQILRERLMKRMTDEKELATALQAHRDQFAQFIWKRRVGARKDMRALFQTGPGMISRFGDLITNSTLESLQSFERMNWARLCKDKIAAGVCSDEDVPAYFTRKIFLAAPAVPADVVVHANRLEVHLREPRSSPDGGTPPPVTPPKNDWGCVYGTAGPWRARLLSRPTIRELVRQTHEQIVDLRRQEDGGDSYSYAHLLSRLIDAVHPSHQLPAAVLANPANGAAVIKRRLRQLGYSTTHPNTPVYAQPATVDEAAPFDAQHALGIIAQIADRLRLKHRFYFEFSAPDRTSWRVGFSVSKRGNANAHARYPGDDDQSFGFSSTGEIYYQGLSHPYVKLQDDSMYFMGFRTWGVVVDLYEGRIYLVVDGELKHVAFGNGATAFNRQDQRRQRDIIQTSELIPAFALQVTDQGAAYAEAPQIRVNFGNNPFLRQVDALPCGAILKPVNTSVEAPTIIDRAGEDAEGPDKEDEDHLRSSMDKTSFRATLAVDAQRSFSQFPPSIYRRSMACTRIQRAWRRMRGRVMRAKIREEQYIAATLIQLVARKKLKRLRAVKNEAAAKIQRNWRRKKLIWLALLRCIYQQPIPELHRAATVIQRKWRNWHMFRNSPLAAKYNSKIEDLAKAANFIIAWWRPLHHQLSETRRLREKYQAARNIQRVWRGYSLRQLLRPELRHRLRALGESVARHREQLLRIHGAYIIQNGWRSYLHKRVRAEKVRTRHRAAARIQALWKGYWVRSHIHLRFSYGEAIFLTAVCKSLRTAHFILKMYRPCGIVCPRREVSYTRDGQKISHKV
ncbi:hypothetical protein BDZ88DRAFT_461954 [Geranomyces variabilis]|nr:hypothetical protein BDZ88DRAFT_461954 [Geranomyces variabilis]KAJ3138326.1 hypothetical protein HDU90_001288 [Geranomyces variabilis]